MNLFSFHKQSLAKQILYCAITIILVSAFCYLVSGLMGYRVVGFILLLTVSFIAIFFDILPVLFSALISAMIWDYFFIPPHFTFQVGNIDDTIMLLMYLVIAMTGSVLMFKIRQVEKQMQAKEERANAIKLYNTMLNSLSHELRTPIATIIAATDNLQEANQKLTPSDRLDLVAEIAKAGFRLNQQVENLLNMSRLESGFIKPKNDWTDIEELFYEVVEQLEENGIYQHISVNIPPNIPLFYLDKGMLQQILYNLLLNACQYTPQGTRIEVTAACHADLLEITVQDNGPGFPKDEVDHVFEKFYRLKNSKTGGTGLGLSIVKGFAEAMNGNIGLSTPDLGGSRFTLTIPAEVSYLKNLKNE